MLVDFFGHQVLIKLTTEIKWDNVINSMVTRTETEH